MKRSVWLIVCLIGVLAVAGLALQPSSALGVQRYQVHVVDDEGNPVPGLTVEFSFWRNVQNDWGPWFGWEDEWWGEDENGDYWYDRQQGIASHWRVRITDAGVIPFLPAVNPYQPPDLEFFFVWWVYTTDP